MNYTAAKQLVKHNGPAKYRGTKLIVLTKLTDALFRGKEDTRDIEGREVKKRTDTVLGWVRLKNPTYLMDVLREIEEIKAERHGRYLKYTIDLSPLQKLEPLDLAKDSPSPVRVFALHSPSPRTALTICVPFFRCGSRLSGQNCR